MKIPQESKEWRKKGNGVWEGTVKGKDHRCKKGFYFCRRIYYEIVCENCGELGLAEKHDIDKGNGRFCSRSCAGKDRKGSKSPNWKGGRKIGSYGYVHLNKPDHPNADKKGYVREHVIEFERAFGILPQKGEVIHHRNGDKTDNRAENLQLMGRGEHVSYHSTHNV